MITSYRSRWGNL